MAIYIKSYEQKKNASAYDDLKAAQAQLEEERTQLEREKGQLEAQKAEFKQEKAEFEQEKADWEEQHPVEKIGGSTLSENETQTPASNSKTTSK